MVNSNEYKVIVAIAEDDGNHVEIVTRAIMSVSDKLITVAYTSGEALIESLKDDQSFPSLILMDINMPGIGGLEALRIIKCDSKLKHIPVVIFSTSEADKDRKAAYSNNANGYLVKPHDYAELKSCMRTVVSFWLDLNRLP